MFDAPMFGPPDVPESYRMEIRYRSITDRPPVGAEKTLVLCVSCRNGMRMRAQNAASPQTWCHAITRFVPDSIVECSRYQRMGSLTLGEMADLALDVGGKRKLGFLREHVSKNDAQSL